MGASSPWVRPGSSSSTPAPIRSKRPSSRSPARRFATRAPRPPIRCGKCPASGGASRVSVVYILWLREVKKYLRPRVQIVIGRTLGGATVAVLQGTLIFVVTLIAGFRPVSLLAVPLAFLVIGLIAVIFSALATAIGSSLKEMQGFQMVMNFLVMPTFFLSGAIYPLEGLPRVLGALTRVDPLTYGVDGVRGLLTGRTHFGVALDVGVLLGAGILFVIFGAWRFSKLEA